MDYWFFSPNPNKKVCLKTEVFLGVSFHEGWFLFALGSLILLRSVALLPALRAHASIPLDR